MAVILLQGSSSQTRSLDALMLWLDDQRRCRLCGKQFLPVTSSWKQRFDRHLNTHSGVRPFTCPYCSHSCSRKDSLKLHMHRKHGVIPKKQELDEFLNQSSGRAYDSIVVGDATSQPDTCGGTSSTESMFLG